MAEDLLSRQVERLMLTEEKGRHFEMGDSVITNFDQSLQHTLACKIMSTKHINTEIFKTTIPRIRNVEGAKVKDAGRNIFFCQFKNKKDKRRFVNDGPWFFDKAMILFEEPKANTSIVEMDFRYVSFWIHFHELPLVGFTRTTAIAIGNLIGNFEKVESDEDGWCWGETLRVRILVDVKKPLRRGVLIKVGSMRTKGGSR